MLEMLFVSPKEFKRRVDICQACPAYVPKTGTCQTCGCFIRPKAKIALFECPMHKWQKPTDGINTTSEPEDNFIPDFRDEVFHADDEPEKRVEVTSQPQENLSEPKPFVKTDY